MIALVIFGLFLILGVLAMAFGVDSREDSSDPRRSNYPVGLE